MDVQKTENRHGIRTVVPSAVAGGVAAAAVAKTFLPAEVKAAIKNSRLGEDAFIAKSKEAAVKTIETLKEATGRAPAINIDAVAENAKNIYPEMVKTAQAAKKQIAKDCILVAGAVAAGKILVNTLIKHKEAKAAKAVPEATETKETTEPQKAD